MTEQNIVILDNSLVKASYKLSLNEMRLIMVLLSKIPPKTAIDPKQPFYITKDDFIRMGSHPDNVARDIRSACSELLNRKLSIPLGYDMELHTHWVYNVLTFKTETFERLKAEYPNAKNDDEFITQLKLHNLLSVIPFVLKSDENLMARVVLHDDVIPYVSELKEKFTKLNLDVVSQFSSYYTFRFYLLIMQWQGQGKIILSIKDIRKMFDLGDKYQATKDLKVWVIDVAIDELNEKSPYSVQYELIKKGRKFIELELKFKLKDKDKNKIKEKNNTERDNKTVDMFDGLTDLERQAIQSRIDDYIAMIESKGEVVSDFYRQNITRKAIAERWGLDEFVKKQEKKQAIKEQKNKEFAERLAEQQREELEKKEREKQRNEIIQRFESLTAEQQEFILDEVAKKATGIFAKIFADKRKENTAHQSPMFADYFKELLF